MKRDLTVQEWKWLRYLMRNGPTPAGVLRFKASSVGRKTKDLKAVRGLVACGLIAKTGAQPVPVGSCMPAEFGLTYEVTEAGREAAEYGCYEVAKRESKDAVPVHA